MIVAWRVNDRSGVSWLVLERDVLSYEEFGGYSRFVVHKIASDISDS